MPGLLKDGHQNESPFLMAGVFNKFIIVFRGILNKSKVSKEIYLHCANYISFLQGVEEFSGCQVIRNEKKYFYVLCFIVFHVLLLYTLAEHQENCM